MLMQTHPQYSELNLIPLEIMTVINQEIAYSQVGLVSKCRSQYARTTRRALIAYGIKAQLESYLCLYKCSKKTHKLKHNAKNDQIIR